MKHILSTSVIVSLLVIFTDAQTFQYSRGWTNGKRSSADPAGSNRALLSHLTGMEKPDEECRLLIQRFLKSPCDVRLANAIVNRNKDLLREMSEDVNDGTALLYDPSPLVDSVANDDVRFKRGTLDRHQLNDVIRQY
ncbi:pro-corazonin-like [Ochlerotatus camptorhynchus]|uniref:pro-corazonin-like n=1 Tax=Ochlerotatus camptorhynchus TaxID=644619 RepID=UPI0031D23545